MRTRLLLLSVLMGGLASRAGATCTPLPCTEEIPNTHLNYVPPPSQVSPTYDFASKGAAVITAWSSAALDTINHLFYVFGGGHGDYGGNERYVLDLTTRVLSRVTSASHLPVVNTTLVKPADTLPDGGPTSRHTYDAVEFLSGVGEILWYGGSRWSGSGGFGRDTWSENPLTTSLVQMQSSYDGTTQPAWYGHTPGRQEGAAATDGRFFWFMDAYRFFKFDPSATTCNGYTVSGSGCWTYASKQFSLPVKLWTAEIDPIHRRFVAIGQMPATGSLAPMRYFDLDGPVTQNIQTVTRAQQPGIEDQRGPCFFYDPMGDQFVGWGGGPTLWFHQTADLNAPWTSKTLSGTLPTYTSAGMFGRCRYDPMLDAAVVVGAVTENFFIFRWR